MTHTLKITRVEFVVHSIELDENGDVVAEHASDVNVCRPADLDGLAEKIRGDKAEAEKIINKPKPNRAARRAKASADGKR